VAHDLLIGDPFLYIGQAHCPDHDLILSGPAGTPPTAGHTNGIEEWAGPYGTSIDQWNDTSHPPANVAHPTLSYTTTFGSNPVGSWLVGSQIPDGWYTVRVQKRGHQR